MPEPTEDELKQRFLDQAKGTAKRAYPAGRISADDDGLLACVLELDRDKKKIILHFGKFVSWVALDPPSANLLLNSLKRAILELGGVVTIE